GSGPIATQNDPAQKNPRREPGVFVAASAAPRWVVGLLGLGSLHDLVGLGLGLRGSGLELALGDLADGFVGLDGAADDFLADADRALDVLAGNLHALRQHGLQAFGVAHFGQLAQVGEGGGGVLLDGGQLQAEDVLGVGQGEAAGLGGGVGELAGRVGELLVVLVHGGLLRVIRQGLPVLCGAT